MPRTPSAVKALRVSERRRLRNRSVRSALRTYVKKARTSVAAGEIEEATDFAKTAVSQLDKAAGKGVIHSNQAARRKSRLMHQLALARSAAQKAAAAEEPKAVPARGRTRAATRAAVASEVADQPRRGRAAAATTTGTRATATSTTRTRATPVRATTARKTAPAQEDAQPKPRQTRTRKTSTD
ncbi:MAG: 30S ribosomal protein S20 [Chloroflexi bacterium]|nr:30S ribosomal protein S20 [Chloroflexota bacterium]